MFIKIFNFAIIPNSNIIYAVKILPNFVHSTMRGTVILSGTLLLFHNILVIAVKFKIDAKEVQVWEVKVSRISMRYIKLKKKENNL